MTIRKVGEFTAATVQVGTPSPLSYWAGEIPRVDVIVRDPDDGTAAATLTLAEVKELVVALQEAIKEVREGLEEEKG